MVMRTSSRSLEYRLAMKLASLMNPVSFDRMLLRPACVIVIGMACLPPSCSLSAAGEGEQSETIRTDLDDRLSRLEAAAERDRREQAQRRGAVLFARSCAACHGRQGRGDGPGSMDLSPRPRNFTAGQFRFRTTPTGALPRLEDLERTIRRGLPGSGMPAFDDLFSSGEIADLSAYLYSLAPPEWREAPLPEPVRVPAAVPPGAEIVSEGRSIFLLLECWTCHGLNGSGRGPSAGSLRDEAGLPIRPTDFRHAPLKGGRRPEDVMRALLTGLNGTPMPSYGEAMLFAREELGSASSFAGRLPDAALKEIDAFIPSCPTREQIDGMDETQRNHLRDHRLEALADYVLSFDRRKGFWYWLFRERPENEPRLP